MSNHGLFVGVSVEEGPRLAIARRAAEVKERRAIFANANANADTLTNSP